MPTSGTTLGCWCAALSNEKSSYDLTICCVCVCLSPLFANYNISNLNITLAVILSNLNKNHKDFLQHETTWLTCASSAAKSFSFLSILRTQPLPIKLELQSIESSSISGSKILCRKPEAAKQTKSLLRNLKNSKEHNEAKVDKLELCHLMIWSRRLSCTAGFSWTSSDHSKGHPQLLYSTSAPPWTIC